MTITAHDIRRLMPGDIARMHDLLTTFAEVFEEPQTYSSARPDDDYLARLLGNEHFIALVALDGDAVVGALTAYVLPKYEQARSEIFIYDLAVAATHRRQGIATALIEAVKPIARDNGAWVLIIEAEQFDEPPIALYTKLGRREDVHHFNIDVD